MHKTGKRTRRKLLFRASVLLLALWITIACGNSTQSPRKAVPSSTGALITSSPNIYPTYTEKASEKITSSPTPKPAIPTLKNSKTLTLQEQIQITQEPFYSGAVEIGTSFEGRPIEVYRFGTGANQRLIIAGIHGGYEWNTINLAHEIIDHILDIPELIPTETTLYVLPSLNPDGESRGHGPIGRANSNQVDLNRNFPVNWVIDWPRTGCWQMGLITAGEYPLSEPESSALAKFMNTHPIDALISIHSAGPGIFPAQSKNSLELAAVLSMASGLPYPPLDTGCEFTGMLADYAADLGIAAVDLELSTHWDTELEMSLKFLNAFLTWAPRTELDLRLPVK